MCAQVVAQGKRCILTVVRPACSHGATILPLNTKANHSICVITIFDLAILTRNIGTVTPTGVVPITALRVETRPLWAALFVSFNTERLHKLLEGRNSLSAILATKEGRGVFDR